MFAIGKFTGHLVLREFVCLVNEVCRRQIRRPEGLALTQIIFNFKDFCVLPAIHGVMDVTQTRLHKFRGPFADEYYAYKS